MTDESDGSEDGFIVHKHHWRAEGKFNIDLCNSNDQFHILLLWWLLGLNKWMVEVDRRLKKAGKSI